ncbi:MAG: OmpH family outer membrane protein [Pirellulales bacterium]|nr:OmpH family outer membrane protein [Pirellulales bacterium]
MRPLRLLATVACVAVCASFGCSRNAAVDSAAVGAVAVIDLDAIAHRLGSDKQIVDSIAQRQSSLSQKLIDLAKSYNQQIEERKKTLTEAPPQQSEVTLANWQQQATANLNKVKQQAELDLQRHRAQLVAQFREEIKPTARRIAESRGLSVIVTKNDSVLYDFAPAVDITEAVVAELKSTREAPHDPAVTAPAPPPQPASTVQ